MAARHGAGDQQEVAVGRADPSLLNGTIGPDRAAALQSALGTARRALGRNKVVHVNSTARGGGVAEMLRRVVAYTRGAGIEARWFSIEGDAPYFALTKRIHHLLHGHDAPGPALDAGAARHYRSVVARNAAVLLRHTRPGDVVVLHDPQAAGVAGQLRRAGARVVWQCHIGCEREDARTHLAWEFLRPHLEDAEAFLFSREDYVPSWLVGRPTMVVPPSIDPLSPKNQPMEPDEVAALVSWVGLGPRDAGPPAFRRGDGSAAVARRRPTALHSLGPPPDDAELVVQVSRWDPLKDMAGVMASFADTGGDASGAHLALVGPDVSGVSDDPEGRRVFDECVDRWRRLPDPLRSRVHLVCLPLEDVDENAAMVNAVQRRAGVVVQKSLAEGFGLTVTEAMWKARPVVATAVGGIRDQIRHGVDGLLVADPSDVRGFGQATVDVLTAPERGAAFGDRARRRALDRFLDDRQLRDHASLYCQMAAR